MVEHKLPLKLSHKDGKHQFPSVEQQSGNKGENGQKRSGKPSHHFCSYKFLFGR
jgi:hypothetical protein